MTILFSAQFSACFLGNLGGHLREPRRVGPTAGAAGLNGYGAFFWGARSPIRGAAARIPAALEGGDGGHVGGWGASSQQPGGLRKSRPPATMLGELEFIKVEYLALNACKRLCPTDS